MVRINNHETPILQKYASEVPEGGLIVEIGSAWGYSATKMAEVIKEGVIIYAIDPWTLAPQKQQPIREQMFFKTIQPFKGKIMAVKSFSDDVNIEALLNGRAIDLLFIDGDHSYEAVKSDYLNYSGYIRQGGVIIFHDFGYWEGVDRAVNEFAAPSNQWDYFTEQRFWIGTKK